MERQESPRGGRVKRTTARLVLVWLGTGIVLLAVGTLLPEGTPGTVHLIKETLRIFGLTECILGAVWWIRFLRCPCCGISFVLPWWSSAERHVCSQCGREIVFDDAPSR